MPSMTRRMTKNCLSRKNFEGRTRCYYLEVIMICHECNKSEMIERQENVRYDESGLPNVVLESVKVRQRERLERLWNA